jgi:hypothetical protein
MQCHPIGLSDLEDSLDLHPGVEDSGHSTFGNHPQLKTEVIQKILVKSFDQWRREQGMLLPDKPAWVAKIDVEGFEEKVLQGMKEALEHRAFIGVAVELNTFTLEFCDSSVEKIEEILTNCGYTPMSRTSRFGLWPLEKTANSFWIPWEFAK